MSRIVIYHGSDTIIEHPIYHYEKSNMNNDYGYGFYCTQNLDMAKEWASRRTSKGFANKYSINEKGLKILNLCDKDKYSVLNWIAILLHHRKLSDDIKIAYQDVLEYLEKYYIDVSEFDIVIGFRADDAYFRFPLMFVKNQLTLNKLEDIYMNGNLGKQYVLISKKAFNRVKYISSIISDKKYMERYIRRKEAADSSYLLLEREEMKSNNKRIIDLMKEDI